MEDRQPTFPTTVYLSEDLRNYVEQVAERKGWSLSQVIANLVSVARARSTRPSGQAPAARSAS